MHPTHISLTSPHAHTRMRVPSRMLGIFAEPQKPHGMWTYAFTLNAHTCVPYYNYLGEPYEYDPKGWNPNGLGIHHDPSQLS